MPTFVPPRPYERGYQGRPTLIQNPETLAQLALIARYGARWYRELGTDADPGSALVTISGAVGRPVSTSWRSGPRWRPGRRPPAARPSRSRRCSSAATSGPGWRPRRRAGARARRSAVGRLRARIGGPDRARRERVRAARERARDRLPGRRVRRPMRSVRVRPAGDRRLRSPRSPTASRTARARAAAPLGGEIRGRGACHHPDGAVRFVESALKVFGDEIDRHARGGCDARPAGLPLGGPTSPEAGRERAVGGGMRR